MPIKLPKNQEETFFFFFFFFCAMKYIISIILCGYGKNKVKNYLYEGRAKSSATNRLPMFYPRYILKCFTALEWCVEQLTIPVYFVQLNELFQIEIDAVIYTDQFTCYIGTWTRRLNFVAILNAALCLT